MLGPQFGISHFAGKRHVSEAHAVNRIPGRDFSLRATGQVSQDTADSCRLITFSTFLQAPKACRQHTAAYTGDRNPESKCTSHRYKWHVNCGSHRSHRYKRHVNCGSHGTNMLYLDCQLDPVRLTEPLRGTCESEPKKKDPPPPHVQRTCCPTNTSVRTVYFWYLNLLGTHLDQPPPPPFLKSPPWREGVILLLHHPSLPFLWQATIPLAGRALNQLPNQPHAQLPPPNQPVPHTLCPLCKLDMCNSSKCAIFVPRNSLPFP